MKIFNLPDLGEGLPDAEIHTWYVKENDMVNLDQPIVAMETAKALVDIPSPYVGTINKLYGKPGDIIKTGLPLFSYYEDNSNDSPTVAGTLKTGNTILPPSATGIMLSRQNKPSVKIMPALRGLAKQLKVTLENIKPSGIHGEITAEDIIQAKFQSQTSLSSLSQLAENLQGTRRAMAIAMAESHSQIVPVTLMDDANVHAWPNDADITVRLIRALVVACGKEPALNAWFNGKSLTRKLLTEIHLGLALDTAEGLFMPVIHQVAHYTAEQLRSHINQLKQQAKQRSLSPELLTGASISLSNFGNLTGRYANPIIVPPMVAILGAGKIRQAVVAYQGVPAIHPIMPLSLTIDHRAVTGGEAARFLAAVIQDLELAK